MQRLLMSTRATFAATVVLGLTTALSAAETFVAHPSTVSTLSRSDIADILLGRKTTWPDGTRIVLVTLDESASPVTASVLKDYVRKSPAQYQAYWKRQVFTGKGSMPKVAKDATEMIAVIAATPGAIGYLEDSQITAQVNQVRVQ